MKKLLLALTTLTLFASAANACILDAHEQDTLTCYTVPNHKTSTHMLVKYDTDNGIYVVQMLNLDAENYGDKFNTKIAGKQIVEDFRNTAGEVVALETCTDVMPQPKSMGACHLLE